MAKQKSERHHWWPVCVSAHWADDDGCVNWLLPNGEVRRAPPKNFGVIGGGHHIKWGREPSEVTPWDLNYEPAFQRADHNFPSLITWLGSLNRKKLPPPVPKSGLRALLQLLYQSTPEELLSFNERFMIQSVSDEEVLRLVEGIVSLAVRSPMNREAAVSLAEDIRGPIPERERNALIGSNMRNSHRDAVRNIGTNGKFVVIYSPEREFIYGDGFYHNIRSPVNNFLSPKALVPITPQIAVLFARPGRYMIEPRLTTLVVTAHETDELNHAVQVYARNSIFYRKDRPNVDEAFRREKHLVYSDHNNPVERLIRAIPGIPPRDTSLDFLAAHFSNR